VKQVKIWEPTKYYAKGLYDYVDEDHCFLLAAGIAFNVLYCILPLSLVGFYFFSATLTSEKAVTQVVAYITNSFPVPVFEEDVRAWLAKQLTGLGHQSNIAGLIGGIALFWLASVLFSTLRTSLNAVLNMPSKKNVILQKLLDFVLMVVILLLLLSSTFLSPIVDLLSNLGGKILPGWLMYILDSAAPRVVSIGISIVLYVLLFRMLPNQRLSRKVIFVAASTTVFLTEAMKLLFVYYMQHLSSIGTLYGTYAFLVGISLWVYYASLAFLIGAEVGWLYKERNEPLVVAEAPVEESVVLIHPGGNRASLDDTKSNPTRPIGEEKIDLVSGDV
jgi:membrane protein